MLRHPAASQFMVFYHGLGQFLQSLLWLTGGCRNWKGLPADYLAREVLTGFNPGWLGDIQYLLSDPCILWSLRRPLYMTSHVVAPNLLLRAKACLPLVRGGIMDHVSGSTSSLVITVWSRALAAGWNPDSLREDYQPRGLAGLLETLLTLA